MQCIIDEEVWNSCRQPRTRPQPVKLPVQSGRPGQPPAWRSRIRICNRNNQGVRPRYYSYGYKGCFGSTTRMPNRASNPSRQFFIFFLFSQWDKGKAPNGMKRSPRGSMAGRKKGFKQYHKGKVCTCLVPRTCSSQTGHNSVMMITAGRTPGCRVPARVFGGFGWRLDTCQRMKIEAGWLLKIEAWMEARKRRTSPPAEPGTATAHESWHARGKAVKMTPGCFVYTQTARHKFLFHFLL